MKENKSARIKMHTLYKTSGVDVRVNDNSLSHAFSIGWTKESPEEIAKIKAEAKEKAKAKKEAEAKK